MPHEQKITLKLKVPNPLFVQWLSEWCEYAQLKNLKTRHVFEKALSSLKKYPLPLNSGEDCIILDGFGPTICRLLDEKLKSHTQHLVIQPTVIPNNVKPTKRQLPTTSSSQPKPKRASPKKKSKPVETTPIVEKEQDESVIMSPFTFDIILIVDTQETSGKQKRIMDATLNGLEKEKITFEVRKLQIGDFAWIARNGEGQEVVLPYIVERKRIDDFAMSIKDGRFHEQKFRLHKSGIENLIYLIESYGNNQHTGLPLKTLLQAATNTQIHGKFIVKFTDCHQDSMMYLAVMTELLIKKYSDKVLISCPKNNLGTVLNNDFIPVLNFNEFNQLSSKTKNLKIREIFIKQLLQLKTLSVDKALAITTVYPTPKSLIDVYSKCQSESEGINVLSGITFGPLRKSIGPQISKILYQFYMEKRLD